jgi:hypothetical protein
MPSVTELKISDVMSKGDVLASIALRWKQARFV